MLRPNHVLPVGDLLLRFRQMLWPRHVLRRNELRHAECQPVRLCGSMLDLQQLVSEHSDLHERRVRRDAEGGRDVLHFRFSERRMLRR